MKEKILWYTRRGEAMQGPYPAGMVTRMILLGRILKTDEISVDKKEWSPVSEHSELIPEVMKIDMDDPLARQKLMAAKRWADERHAGDRRDDAADQKTHPERRNRTERRETETGATVRHRSIRSARPDELDSLKRTKTKNKIFGVLASVIIVSCVFLFLAIYKKPVSTETEPDCNLRPKPGINWRNCKKDGISLELINISRSELQNIDFSRTSLRGSNLIMADLSYANLSSAVLSETDFSHAKLVGVNLRNADIRDANFQGADLSYADLTEAVITGINIESANLENAKWVDGSICVRGSIGKCLVLSGEQQ